MSCTTQLLILRVCILNIVFYEIVRDVNNIARKIIRLGNTQCKRAIQPLLDMLN